MRRLVLTPQARRDAATALKDSRAKFGPTARARYALLIKTAYRDLLEDPEHLSALYPSNQNVRPKIRQQLQVLRDQGYITFLGRGRYGLARRN